MQDRPGFYHAAVFVFLFFLLTGSPGCLSDIKPDSSLTPGSIADQYQKNADAIGDYRAEYRGWTGQESDPALRLKVRFDYKSPVFARMEILEADYSPPGFYGVSNGTTTILFDAESQTYHPEYRFNLIDMYDYQSLAHRVVADRNFTVIERVVRDGTDRYLIDAVPGSWLSNYTGHRYTHIRAWIEPSTGLAWAVRFCDECGTPVPTLLPGEMAAMSPIQYNEEIRYESIEVNTGIPESYFDFIPPEGSRLLPGPYV